MNQMSGAFEQVVPHCWKCVESKFNFNIDSTIPLLSKCSMALKPFEHSIWRVFNIRPFDFSWTNVGNLLKPFKRVFWHFLELRKDGLHPLMVEPNVGGVSTGRLFKIDEGKNFKLVQTFIHSTLLQRFFCSWKCWNALKPFRHYVNPNICPTTVQRLLKALVKSWSLLKKGVSSYINFI